MKPWKTLARDGALVLQERDGEHVLRSGGVELMSSRRHRSEAAMAAHAAGAKRVLVGGLGLGFTLRAVLEAAPEARVVVAELSNAVVEWNRTLLHTASLDDARVTVHLGDVAEAEGRFDCILLDVDNGPAALSDPGNAKLYAPKGIARFKAMLKPRGVLVVWSAGPSRQFLQALGRAGFEASEQPSGAHTLFVARLRS